MRPRKMMPLLLLCSAALLTGCADRYQAPPEIQVERQPVPASMLDAPPKPLPPADGTQRDVAAYIIQLDLHADQLAGKLAAVREVVTVVGE